MKCLAIALALAGCVGSGDVPASVSGQIVGDDEKPLGPGLVLIEKGKVHEGSYQLGGRIGQDGRFSVELGSGGTWGLHLFHDDYSYLPLEITIAEHQQVLLTNMMVAWGVWMDLTGLPTWPDQPDDANLIRMPVDDNMADNPVLSNITMTYPSPGLLQITVDANDPDGDLSRMVLVYDEATGGGHALNPPSPPDDKGNFPNGTYSLKVFLDPRHVPGASKLLFILSDNLCNNSPVVERTLP